MPVRVVKLGGSLLSSRNVAKVFRHWLTRQPSLPTLVLVGGGRPVERLRRNRGLGQVTAHWRAIECMDQNARDFANRSEIPSLEADVNELIAALQRFAGPCPHPPTWIVVSARQIVQQLDAWPGLPPLPRAADVTSDSIAAQIASVLDCRELALLKSCDVPGVSDFTIGRNRHRGWSFPAGRSAAARAVGQPAPTGRLSFVEPVAAGEVVFNRSDNGPRLRLRVQRAGEIIGAGSMPKQKKPCLWPRMARRSGSLC